MQFCFYPKHEYGCPQVSHCPHLGGAALGTLVAAADEHDPYLQMLLGQLDFERGRSTKLFEENVRLQARIEQLKLGAEGRAAEQICHLREPGPDRIGAYGQPGEPDGRRRPTEETRSPGRSSGLVPSAAQQVRSVDRSSGSL